MYFLLHTEMAVREMAMIPGKWTFFRTTSSLKEEIVILFI